jgi:hypothetical protein
VLGLFFYVGYRRRVACGRGARLHAIANIRQALAPTASNPFLIVFIKTSSMPLRNSFVSVSRTPAPGAAFLFSKAAPEAFVRRDMIP